MRDVSFTVERGEILGLVGESGSGKTISSLALMGLLPHTLELRSGYIELDGRALTGPDGRIERAAGDMTMIFQDPQASLNPTMRAGAQVARALRVNQGLPRREARDRAVEMFARVGISGPGDVAESYPHQLSGGMCQRVMIAMALACRPKILIADEATTALDVTIQAQIFDLIQELVEETACGVVFITHDLASVAEMCDRVDVLYGGQLMEQASTIDLFEDHANPYSQYLFESIGRDVDPRSVEETVDYSLPGCRFANRCPYVFDQCDRFPPLYTVGDEHRSACFLPYGG